MSSSDLFVIATMSASKLLYDAGEDGDVYNRQWSDESHIALRDLNQMEIEFAKALVSCAT